MPARWRFVEQVQAPAGRELPADHGKLFLGSEPEHIHVDREDLVKALVESCVGERGGYETRFAGFDMRAVSIPGCRGRRGGPIQSDEFPRAQTFTNERGRNTSAAADFEDAIARVDFEIID